MRLEISGRIVSESADARTVEAALRGMSDPDDTAILSREELSYVQAAGCVSDGFALERQEGSLETHFAAKDTVAIDALVGAFLSYLSGDQSWRERFSWEKVDL